MNDIESNEEDIRQLRLQFCPDDNRPICIAIGEVISNTQYWVDYYSSELDKMKLHTEKPVFF